MLDEIKNDQPDEEFKDPFNANDKTIALPVALGDWHTQLQTSFQQCTVHTADLSMFPLQDAVFDSDDVVDYEIESGPSAVA